MQARARLVAAALLPLLAACAAPRLYYAGPARASHVREAQRDALLRVIDPALAREGIERMEVRSGDERIVRERSRDGVLALDGIPVLALQAARAVLARQYRGAELDVLVDGSGAGDPARIWSVSRDLEHGLTVVRGAARQPPARATPTPAELTQRFSIGSVEDSTEARWAPDELRALALALDLLTPAELELLAGLSFERRRVGPDPRHAGLYVRTESSGGKVQLFDLAFGGDADGYVGGTQQARPYAVYVILHEIGHAIAKLYRERLLAQYRKDVDGYNALVAQLNRKVDEYGRARQRLAAAERSLAQTEERRALELRRQALEREIAQTRQELGRARRELGRVEKIAAGPTPMEQLYAELPLALAGPTPYGRTDVSESFAESFALFHVDPDSLERIAPAVHAWFDSGQHLRLSDLSESGLAGAGAPGGR